MTETALLKVTNYILMAPDAGNYTVVLLIVRHCYTVTLNRLHQVVGVSRSALGWFKSYLADLPALSVLIISCQKRLPCPVQRLLQLFQMVSSPKTLGL